MKIVGGDARDPLADVLAASRFNGQDHVFIRIAADDAKEAGKLGFEKAPVKGELSALKSGSGRQGGLGRGFGMRQFEAARMFGGLALHRINHVSSLGLRGLFGRRFPGFRYGGIFREWTENNRPDN
jgi:hypothetical protein